MSKKKLSPGDRVRTNARYARDISRVPREGTLDKELTWIGGLWRVILIGFDRPQHMHESYVEKVT